MVLSMKRGAAVLCSLLVAVLTWEALPGVGSSAVAAASTDWEEAAFERKVDPLTVTNLRGLEEAVRTRFKRCRERGETRRARTRRLSLDSVVRSYWSADIIYVTHFTLSLTEEWVS